MEIHPPGAAPLSLKEFLVHIGIVTIGILIALGCEGIRETMHDRTLVEDARRNFAVELNVDRDHLKLERKSLDEMQSRVGKLIQDLPSLAHDPGQLRSRADQLRPGFYFFSLVSWQTALSTGALGRMSTDEVDRFAGAYFSVQAYSHEQAETVPIWLEVVAFLRSRKQLDAGDLSSCLEKLELLRMHGNILAHLSGELADGLSGPVDRK